MSKNHHHFEVGLVTGGRHAAVSLTNPYFCLVTDTHEEAVAAAHRALNFYFEASGQINKTDERHAGVANTTTQSTFRPLESLEG